MFVHPPFRRRPAAAPSSRPLRRLAASQRAAAIRLALLMGGGLAACATAPLAQAQASAEARRPYTCLLYTSDAADE